MVKRNGDETEFAAVYEQIGRNVVEAARDLILHIKTGQEAESPAQAVDTDLLNDLRLAIASIEERMASLEAKVHGADVPETEARQTSQRKRPSVSRGDRKAPRMSKEKIREVALKAAKAIADDGQKVTMRAVANKSGLQYGQVAYAFGRVENLLEELHNL